MENLDEIYSKLKKILQNRAKSLLITDKYIGSQSTANKPGFHLYGNREVSLFGKKPQKTYVAGAIQQKSYVSLYFSPIHSHPAEFSDISSDLKKFLKGKSCFNIKKANSALLKEIDTLLAKGINYYKEIKWI